MSTKAQLEEQLSKSRVRMHEAIKNSLENTSLRDLSSELLGRIDNLRSDKEGEKTEIESELDALDNAYEAVDSADDRIREVSE